MTEFAENEVIGRNKRPLRQKSAWTEHKGQKKDEEVDTGEEVQKEKWYQLLQWQKWYMQLIPEVKKGEETEVQKSRKLYTTEILRMDIFI